MLGKPMVLTIVGHDIPTGSDNHSSSLEESYSGWWFGTVFMFFPYIGNNHPI
jgi:hypothetical protein